MNVIVGVLIGIISASWSVTLIVPFIWGVVSCIYGYIFKLHKNPVVECSSGGQPLVSYFIARYMTSALTSLVFSLIAFLIKRYVF